MRIGELLVSKGALTPDQLDTALKVHKAHGIKLGSCLVKMGFVKEGDLVQLLSEKLYVPHVSTEELNKTTEQTINALSGELAIKHQVFPFSLEGGRLSLAMSDPSNFSAIDEIAFTTGYVIKSFVAPDYVISHLLAKFYDHDEADSNYRFIPQGKVTTPDSSEIGNLFNIEELKNYGECDDLAEFAEEKTELPSPMQIVSESNDFKRMFVALLNVLEQNGLVSRQEIIDELLQERLATTSDFSQNNN